MKRKLIWLESRKTYVSLDRIIFIRCDHRFELHVGNVHLPISKAEAELLISHFEVLK